LPAPPATVPKSVAEARNEGPRGSAGAAPETRLFFPSLGEGIGALPYENEASAEFPAPAEHTTAGSPTRSANICCPRCAPCSLSQRPVSTRRRRLSRKHGKRCCGVSPARTSPDVPTVGLGDSSSSKRCHPDRRREPSPSDSEAQEPSKPSSLAMSGGWGPRRGRTPPERANVDYAPPVGEAVARPWRRKRPTRRNASPYRGNFFVQRTAWNPSLPGDG
jgi:hypothetical protein